MTVTHALRASVQTAEARNGKKTVEDRRDSLSAVSGEKRGEGEE